VYAGRGLLGLECKARNGLDVGEVWVHVQVVVVSEEACESRGRVQTLVLGSHVLGHVTNGCLMAAVNTSNSSLY